MFGSRVHCPFCGHANRPGGRHCDRCLASLTLLDHLPPWRHVRRSYQQADPGIRMLIAVAVNAALLLVLLSQLAIIALGLTQLLGSP